MRDLLAAAGARRRAVGLLLPRPDALLVHYPCAAGQGAVIEDVSGRGRHADLIGGGWGTMASGAMAVDFAAISGHRIDPPAAVATAGNIWSVAMVVELDDLSYSPSNKSLLASGSYPADQVQVARTLNNVTPYRLYFMPAPNSSGWSGASFGVIDQRETILVLVADGTSGTRMHLRPAGAGWATMVSSLQQYRLKDNLIFGSGNGTINGRIRNISVWDTALTEAEACSLDF